MLEPESNKKLRRNPPTDTVHSGTVGGRGVTTLAKSEKMGRMALVTGKVRARPSESLANVTRPDSGLTLQKPWRKPHGRRYFACAGPRHLQCPVSLLYSPEHNDWVWSNNNN